MLDLVQPTVSLSEPPTIPEKHRETVLSFLRQIWQRYNWNMRELLGFQNLAPLTDDQLLRTFMAEHLAVIARAAAGDVEHTEDNAGYVAETIQSVMESLYSTPVSYEIPSSFYDSDIGQIVARAQLWLREDELITLAAAAELRDVTVQAISQAVRDGRLRGYVNPDAPARQGRTLVSRVEVEAMA